MKIVFLQMSLAFFVLANLDSWSLLCCSITGPPLLSSTGHLGNRIGRNGARVGGAWAVGGGEGKEVGGGEEVHTEAARHLMTTAGATEDEVTEDL